MAYLNRQATEAKSRGTREWIKQRTEQRRSHIPYENQGSARNAKEMQLRQGTTSFLTGLALIAPFLKDKFRETELDQCWCETGEKQTSEHLFKHCKRWKAEINVLCQP